jgi:hypothetical protein
VQTNDRIDREGGHSGSFSHHLSVDLALRGHVDDNVVVDVRRASQPLSVEQRPLSLIIELDRARWG